MLFAFSGLYWFCKKLSIIFFFIDIKRLLGMQMPVFVAVLYCQQDKVHRKEISSPAYLGSLKGVFLLKKDTQEPFFFSLAVSSLEMIDDLKYWYHLKKSLIRRVMNWINKRRKVLLRFFLLTYITFKQPCFFKNVS